LASGKKKGLLHFIDTARAKWGTQVKKEIFKQPCLLHREPISDRFLKSYYGYTQKPDTYVCETLPFTCDPEVHLCIFNELAVSQSLMRRERKS